LSLIRFRVELPNGAVEELAVEGEQALVGTGAHCEIRLPMQAGQPEHVLIRSAPGNLWARALSFQPPPLLNGSPFGDAPVMNDSILSIGPVRIRIALTEDDAGAVRVQKKKRKSNPVVIWGGLAVAFMMFAQAITNVLTPQGQIQAAPSSPPKLWEDPIKTCPRNDPRQAFALATERTALAESRRERRPFSARDGVAAVPLFEEAAACFRVAGNQEAAQRSIVAASRLRDEIDLDYRTHQVRLEHAINVNDGFSALREMEVLLALTETKTGPYVTWLSIQQRALRAQIDAPKK
jgi:hypothetical protein